MKKSLREQLSRGILLINKQAGRTSHDEVAIIKRALRHMGIKEKVGHSGTLDPKVTGLLVVGIGKGTRVLEYMLLSEKRYVGEIVFHQKITEEQLESAIKNFTGTIEQLPPVKSSVKRQLRKRDIYHIAIKSFNPDKKTAILECAVERGTYIRKLFHDMGEYIGIRAHMGDLHRIQVGPFTEQDGMITSDAFETISNNTQSLNPFLRYKALRQLEKTLVPIEQSIQHLPYVILHPTVDQYLSAGQDVFVPGIQSVSDDVVLHETIMVLNQQKKLIVIGKALMTKEEMRTKKKGIAIEVHKVLV